MLSKLAKSAEIHLPLPVILQRSLQWVKKLRRRIARGPGGTVSCAFDKPYAPALRFRVLPGEEAPEMELALA